MVYTKAHHYYQNNTEIRLPDYTTPTESKRVKPVMRKLLQSKYLTLLCSVLNRYIYFSFYIFEHIFTQNLVT